MEPEQDLPGVRLIKKLGGMSALSATLNMGLEDFSLEDEFSITIYFGLMVACRYPDLAARIYDDWNLQWPEQSGSDMELDMVADILRAELDSAEKED